MKIRNGLNHDIAHQSIKSIHLAVWRLAKPAKVAKPLQVSEKEKRN